MEPEKGPEGDWHFVVRSNSKCCAHTAAREIGANLQDSPHGKTGGKTKKIDRKDPKVRFPAA